MIKHTKNSKIKLLLKIIILLFTIGYVYIANTKLIYKTHFKIGNNTITGIITNIKYKEKYTEFTVNSKDKIKVYYYGDKTFKIGDKVKLDGELKYPNNNTIFNLYNYKKYLLSEKIFFILTTSNVEVLKNTTNIIYNIKNYIYSKTHKLKSGDYINTFILADKSNLDSNILNIYKENGISHLLAISGMHISLITLILSKILMFKNKNMFISVFLIFYLFLIDFTPSSIRSVLSFILGRKLNAKDSIFIILVLMLLYNPFYIYNVGFIFSFVISIYLIYFSKLIKGSYIKKIFKISLISFIVSIPILINNYNEINLISPLINVFFVPFISILIFPLCIITLFLPILDNILFFLIQILNFISRLVNNFNIILVFSNIKFIFLIIYYIVITLVLIKPKYFYIFITLLLIHYNIRLFHFESNIVIFDVNQGDSILFDLDKTILIDTGGYYESNLALSRIIPYLKSLGIRKLDYLVLTHGDFDHMGESINLVNNFKVEKVIFNCGEYNDLEKNLINILDNKKIPYYSCIKELNIDNNKLYFLQTKEYDNENDNSNVIYAQINEKKLLLMGDASTVTEKEILTKYDLTNIDVFKVGHHGSKTSSGEEFINKINPKYSIISVGKNNRYGHPNKEVLDNLNNSKIYRTDQDGSIMFKIKKDKLKIATCPS